MRGVPGVTVLVVAATSMRASATIAAPSLTVPDSRASGDVSVAVLLSVPLANGRCTL